MKYRNRIFSNLFSNRGTVLIEFLLTIGLAATLMPFIYSYQQRAITRAENLKVARNMQKIQTVLERYIVENKDSMLTTVGRTIFRLELADLVAYGLDEEFVKASKDKYQLRILKSVDASDQAALQGIIVFDDADITPIRTREIVQMGDDKIGFIDGTKGYGGFGTWRTDMVDLDIENKSGIIQTTAINRDNSLYLWRVPSESAADATMLSALNIGNRDIKNATFVNAAGLSLGELLDTQKISTNDLIFTNRTTIDSTFNTPIAVVSGAMSGDSKNISVSGTLNLADMAKVSNLTVDNLWVNNLSLGSLSTPSDSVSTLRATGSLDMTEGRVSALYVTVGFTGSLTPRLVVKNKIVDSTNSNYFWDLQKMTANFADINSPTLSDMAPKILRKESVSGSAVTRIFSSVVANKNATMADFLNAIRDIQQNVRGKYRMLKLE